MHSCKRAVLLAFLLAPFLSACRDAPQLALFELKGVDQAEADETLFVAALGLPAAHGCEAELTGTLYHYEAPSEPLELTLPCRAESAESLRVQLGAARLEGGLFDGSLEVRFAASDRADRALSARLPRTVFRVRERAPERVLASARAADALQNELGIARLEQRDDGLVVQELRADGLAARAGLRPLDRIARVSGQPVERTSDFVAARAAGRVALEVVRGSEIVRIEIERDVGGAQVPPSHQPMLALVAFLAALFVPIAPRPGQLGRARRGEVALGWSLGAGLVWAALTLNAGVLVSLAVCCGGLLAQRVIAVMRGETPADELAEACLRCGAIALAVVTFSLLRGSTEGAASPVRDPAAWPLCSSPLAWLVWWVLVVAIEDERRTRAFGGALLTATITLLTAELMMDGRSLPFSWGSSLLWAPLLVAKACALWALPRPSLPARSARRVFWAAPLLPILAWAWLGWSKSAMVSAVAGPLACGAALGLLLRSGLGLVSYRPRWLVPSTS